jgi:phosphoglycolate phosphatase-like HAD superfamily hydrolase
VDDAIAAQSAQIPFVGVLAREAAVRRERVALLEKFGARAVLYDVRDLERWLRVATSGTVRAC